MELKLVYVEKYDDSNHVCPVNARSIHQRMYNCFIDKVGDRKKIKFDEYHKIIDDIVEKNPEFADYFYDAVLGDYRWYRKYIEEEHDLYMVKHETEINNIISVSDIINNRTSN